MGEDGTSRRGRLKMGKWRETRNTLDRMDGMGTGMGVGW